MNCPLLHACVYGTLLQAVLQLRHQSEALQNEIDMLKKQITFRDEFIEVGPCVPVFEL